MKIYLDTCSLQRPFDSKEQARVRLEAEAVLLIIALCESEALTLISSDALLFENRRIPDPLRREFALETLRQAKTFAPADDVTQARAQEFIAKGIMPLDALHLASAEAAQADCFCTCDDKLLKKAKPLCEPGLRILSPVRLLEEIEYDA